MKKGIFFLLFINCIFSQNAPILANNNTDQKIKILFAMGVFPVWSETPNLMLVTEMIKRGHDVHIYADRKGDLKTVHSKVHKYQLLKKTIFEHLPQDLNTYDIILSQFGPIGLKFLHQKDLKPKLVTCFRGYDIGRGKQNPHFYDALFERGNLFLPVCEHFKKILINLSCDPKKIQVLHSPIDYKQFPYICRDTKDPLKIITVGRLVSKKGTKYAISAILKLMKCYPNIEYTIVGDGYLKAQLKKTVEKSEFKTRITFTGPLNHEDIAKKLGESDIFVLPSVTPGNGNIEGIPNALKEAMASGLPVVSTYHSGIPELITDGIEGFLVRERNINELAQKIEELIINEDLRYSMGLAGRIKIIEKYDTNYVIDKFERILYSLLKK